MKKLFFIFLFFPMVVSASWYRSSDSNCDTMNAISGDNRCVVQALGSTVGHSGSYYTLSWGNSSTWAAVAEVAGTTCTSNPYALGCACDSFGTCYNGNVCHYMNFYIPSSYHVTYSLGWVMDDENTAAGCVVSSNVYVAGGHIILDDASVVAGNLSATSVFLQNDFSHKLYVQSSLSIPATTIYTIGDSVSSKIADAYVSAQSSPTVNLGGLAFILAGSLPSGTTDSAYIVAPSTLTLAGVYGSFYNSVAAASPWLAFLEKFTLPVPASALDINSLANPCFDWFSTSYCANIPWLPQAYEWVGWLVLFLAFFDSVWIAFGAGEGVLQDFRSADFSEEDELEYE